jgi:hypothetical protein
MLHKHRIVPGHMGGTYVPENVALLTISQHAEAHHQLFLEHGHAEDKIAWLGLSGQISKEEIIAAVLSMAATKRNQKHNSRVFKGVPKSAEHKQKIGLANRGNKRPDIAARNLLGLNKGMPKSTEHRQKISQAMMGHIVSKATRQKISAAHKGHS